MTPLEADLELARTAALEAGRAAMAAFGTDHRVVHKEPDQPLTDADLAANVALHRILHGQRPGYGWLSEETADSAERLSRDRVWVVDPIDGTRSYIQAIPEFAVSVALVEHGRAVVGVVLNPATGELFRATAGGGAWLERPGRPPQPLYGPGASPGTPTILASRSEIRAGEFAPFDAAWRISPLGSTAYKLARVAAGGGHVFLSRGPKSEWDVCAGALIVVEAGGVASDLRGAPLAYNRPDPRIYGILAGTPRLHAAVLASVVGLDPTPRMREWMERTGGAPG